MPISFEDKLEIQELTARYAMAMDKGNLEEWLGTWADDGVWEGGVGRYEGKVALKSLFHDLGERISGKRHVMTNSIISQIDSDVVHTCYILIFERETSTHCIGTGVYSDKLKKVDGRWRFAHRTIKLDPSFGLQPD